MTSDFKYSFEKPTLLLLKVADVVSHPVNACKNKMCSYPSCCIYWVDSATVLVFPRPGFSSRMSWVGGVEAIKSTARSTSSPTTVTGLSDDCSTAVFTIRTSASSVAWRVYIPFSWSFVCSKEMSWLLLLGLVKKSSCFTGIDVFQDKLISADLLSL